MWWDRFCQRTYCRKLQAWSRCDWPAYYRSVAAAKRAQAIAFRRHRRSLLSQDLMIVYGGTSLRILVGYVSLVVAPPLMLMIWLLILWRSYHYLLILILVHLLFRRSYLKFHIKSLGE